MAEPPIEPRRRHLFEVGASRAAWTCNDDKIVVHGPMAALPAAVAVAIEAWMLDHGIDPATVVHGLPIIRDTVARKVTWWATSANGSLSERSFLRFGDRATAWPAPFPDALDC